MWFIIIGITTVVMFIISIEAFQMLPVWVKNRIAWSPIFGWIVELAISGIMAMFTSTGMAVGIGNLASGCLLMIYIRWWKKKYNVRTEIRFKRFLFRDIKYNIITSDYKDEELVLETLNAKEVDKGWYK